MLFKLRSSKKRKQEQLPVSDSVHECNLQRLFYTVNVTRQKKSKFFCLYAVGFAYGVCPVSMDIIAATSTIVKVSDTTGVEEFSKARYQSFQKKTPNNFETFDPGNLSY